MPTPPLIAIDAQHIAKQVTSGDDTITIIEDVSLQVKKGGHIAITGPSGSGKTTLLSLLASLDTPTHGEIYINGINITTLDEEARTRIRADHVGFIFQHFHLLPNLTAIENVTLALDLKRTPKSQDIAMHWLNEVGLSHRHQHYPSTLSGGEMQRVAIARAFALSPTLLFADEPTGNLDEHTAETIIHLLFEMNKNQNTTLILVTHDKNLAKRTDKSYLLKSGKLS